MAANFDLVSFVWRWIFALALVFVTYNPTPYSYASWLMSGEVTFGPLPLLLGLLLLIGWLMFIRSTFRSIGLIGVLLGAAVFAAFIWLLFDLGWLDLDSKGLITWLSLLVVSLILALGMSWSHIRRRLTGQLDVDDVDE